MRIQISEMIGTRCIIKDDGQKVFDTIFDSLVKHQHVYLDFKGVTQFASPFFNFAIGQLLKNIDESELRKYLHLEHLNETGTLVVKHVLDNASRYHKDQDYRKIVDDILEKQSRESE